MRNLVILPLFFFLLAEKSASGELIDSTPVQPGGVIQTSVFEDPDNVFHVLVRAPLVIKDEQFDHLSLHRYVEGEPTMNVAVVVEETPNLMLEGWVHVVGVEELSKHSLHVYYFVSCPRKKGSHQCRRENVVKPIDFVDGA